MQPQNYAITESRESIIATHKVLRNTYLLLSLSITFSAIIALITMATNTHYPGPIVAIAGMFGKHCEIAPGELLPLSRSRVLWVTY